VNLNAQRITGLAASAGPSDAVRRSELDAVLNGTDWKESVDAKSVGANVVLTGLQTLGTVALGEGSRALLTDQVDPTENTIWVVHAGAWTRAADADDNTLTSAAAVMVEGGPFAGTQWRLSTPDPIDVGATALTWIQFGAAAAHTASGGVELVGNDFRLSGNVPRKFVAAVGTGVDTQIVINHGLATRDVTVSVYYDADGEEVECQVRRTSASVVTLGFALPPAANELRCVVVG
jgi:hypothetical protein